MKKLFLNLACAAAAAVLCAVSAGAVTNDMVKVGLRYDSGALFSANLENAVGGGYSFGTYDSARNFESFGRTGETALSVTASGTVYLTSGGTYSSSDSSESGSVIGAYHIQTKDTYGDYDAAAAAAASYSDGYPAYISDTFRVRIGSYRSAAAAEAAMGELGVSGTAVKAGSTGVLVTVTKTTRILFEYDCQGASNLAILPDGQGERALTWFKGYKYAGGFEYARVTGGNINVINVVNLEDYVKGVIPYEMSGTWPEEALKALAVCSRTYVRNTTKHLKTYGFDVCNTTHCQVYNGANRATALSDRCAEETAGKCLYCNGRLIDAVYFSSDGGATEDSKNVWGTATDYLIGKKDPYEAAISIPNYHYSVTYTAAQLTWILQNSGYSIGTVADAYVSAVTEMGNVYQVTFVDTAGKKLVVTGDRARTAFYSSTYGKSVPSMRFEISGGSGGTASGGSGSFYVNGPSDALNTLDGVYTISGGGTVGAFSGSSPYVITSSGRQALTAASGSGAASSGSGDSFTVTGTGSGHNVGMSQYGACSMAKQGFSYEDILNFYYTNVTIG
jgi:stage II sporulation protein D